jgi:7-cyano-7-deazaguanine synthase
MKAVVLLSGGMDSVTALYDTQLSHDVVGAVSFDYGAKHNAREIPFALWHADRLRVPHRTIRLPFINELFASDLLLSGGQVPDGHYEEESMRRTVVPFRNGIMISIAAGYAESRGGEALVLAAHSGDHAIYPDCREEFLSSMETAVRLGTYGGLALLRPFVHLDKAGIVSRGARLRIDYAHTWSCYKGAERHCGTCGTCVERREAFLRAGVPDPTDYQSAAPLPARPG